ncbi:hypothetical protein ACLOJK_040149 [Asimina triloba]
MLSGSLRNSSRIKECLHTPDKPRTDSRPYFISPENGIHDRENSAFILDPKNNDVVHLQMLSPSISGTIGNPSARARRLQTSSSSAFLKTDRRFETEAFEGDCEGWRLRGKSRKNQRNNDWKKIRTRCRDRRDSTDRRRLRNTGIIRPLAPEVSSSTGAPSPAMDGKRKARKEEIRSEIQKSSAYELPIFIDGRD